MAEHLLEGNLISAAISTAFVDSVLRTPLLLVLDYNITPQSSYFFNRLKTMAKSYIPFGITKFVEYILSKTVSRLSRLAKWKNFHFFYLNQSYSLFLRIFLLCEFCASQFSCSLPHSIWIQFRFLISFPPSPPTPRPDVETHAKKDARRKERKVYQVWHSGRQRRETKLYFVYFSADREDSWRTFMRTVHVSRVFI